MKTNKQPSKLSTLTFTHFNKANYSMKIAHLKIGVTSKKNNDEKQRKKRKFNDVFYDITSHKMSKQAFDLIIYCIES